MPSASSNPKNGKSPKFSANMLGAYICSSDTKRTSILVDQKYPTPKQAHYTPATRIVVAYLLNRDKARFAAAIKEMDRKIAATDNASVRKKLQDNVKAIRSFIRLRDKLSLDVGILSKAGKGPHLEIEGLSVSVSPEVRLLTGKGVGFIKLRFSAEHFSLDVSAYAALLLVKYGELTEPKLYLENTLVVDVINKTIYDGTKVRDDSWRRIKTFLRRD